MGGRAAPGMNPDLSAADQNGRAQGLETPPWCKLLQSKWCCAGGLFGSLGTLLQCAPEPPLHQGLHQRSGGATKALVCLCLSWQISFSQSRRHRSCAELQFFYIANPGWSIFGYIIRADKLYWVMAIPSKAQNLVARICADIFEFFSKQLLQEAV